MTVRSIGFVGMRTGRLDETVSLFRDVIGATITRQSDGMAGFKLPDGAILELYGPDERFHSFFKTGPVVGFRVEDFDATRKAMVAAGVNFIGNSQHSAGTSWQHFYCHDGTIAEIIGQGAESSHETS